MRIAYVVHQYLPDHVGGTELYTHGLARRAVDAGHEVTVLTYRETASNREADFVTTTRSHEGVAVRELTHNLGVASNIALAEYENPATTAWLRDQLTELAPDVVHVTHAMKFGIGAIDAAKALGLPVVVTLTDFWFLCPRHTLLTWDGRVCTGPTSWRECAACTRDLHGVRGTRAEVGAIKGRPARLRAALASADRVVALAPFMLRTFAANGYDVDRFDLIPHGLEPEALASAKPRPERIGGTANFAFIGSLVRAKGAHVALEALRAAPDLDARLVIHGDGPERDALEQQATADRRVTFAGPFPPNEFGLVLSGTDCVLAPSLSYDNEPLVVKGALHLGVPVIASAIGSLVDMIDDGVDGWLVPPGDVDAWARVFEKVHGELGRRVVQPQPQPTMDDTYGALEEIYTMLLSEAA